MASLAASTNQEKPRKPHRDFPLFPHATRRWAKKIRGKLHYFGPWDDPQGALQRYLDQKDDLLAGRTPRGQKEGCSVRDLVNRFLTTKRHLADTHELKERTFQDYHSSCGRVIDAFGKSRLVDDLLADDFEGLRTTLAKTRGPVALGNEIQRIRVLFKYAYDQGLIDRPMRYGQTFRRPSRKTLRLARNAKGPRLFKRRELRAMIESAGPQVRAMILLGINCGLGNSDVGHLPLLAVDLERGWLRFPRPKTGVDRRCKLWPETVEALRVAIEKRPQPKSSVDADLVFITKRGQRWAHDRATSPLSAETAKLLTKLGLKRPGLNFYALRHTFETIAGDRGDQVAVDFIMGHAPSSRDMGAVYRERVFDHRLVAVVKHVRRWLFGGRRAVKSANPAR